MIMIKAIYFSLIWMFLSLSLSADSGYKIDVNINGYDQDTLIVGYYYGKSTLVLDTLLKSEKNDFLLQGDESLDPGVYLLLMKPDNQFVQFLIDDKDQEFQISFDKENMKEIDYKGSEENELFSDYMTFLTDKRRLRQSLKEQIDSLELSEVEKTLRQKQIDEIDDAVDKEQLRLMEMYPNSITKLLIKANRPVPIPEFTGTDKEIHQQKYMHYREHYFDNVELANPATLRTPFIHERVQYFMQKLTYQTPDSVKKSVDYILDSTGEAEDTYRYYLGTFLNDYSRAKIVGLDEVYVYLAEEYYAQGKAPWLDDEQIEKIKTDALKIKPTLIGKKAPDFFGYTNDGEKINLADVEADYRVLFFWRPGCGHCDKAAPLVKDFYSNYRDKGVKLIAICTKLGKEYNTCWPEIEKKGIGEFINIGDQYQRSKVLSKYNATQTPKFFIIDKEGTIVMKGIGAAQLGDVMEELFSREKEDIEK